MFRLKKKVKIILSLLLIFAVSFFVVTKINTKSITKETKINDKQYNQVQPGEEKVTGTDYIKFDAFFLKDTDNDGNAESYRGASINMSKRDKLYLDFKVLGDVTFKNGTIEFVNDNVKLSGTVPKSDVVKQTYKSDDFDKIAFNTVGNGLSTLMELNVNPNINGNIEKYSGTNKVIFKGTVVDNVTKKEIPVTKEISYKVDWYTTDVKMYESKAVSYMDMDNLTVRYTFITQTNTNAIIRDTTISGTVSSLIGVAPESVVITSSDGKVDYTYDKDSQVFLAVKEKKEVDGIQQNAYDYESSGTYYNYWTITVKYPKLEKALYDTSINVSIDSYAYVTNNLSVGYDDVKSNVLNKIITYYIPSPDVDGNLVDSSSIDVGTYSYKKEKYYIDSSDLMSKFLGENIEENFTYPVNWKLSYKYTTTDTGKVTVKDYFDHFKATDDMKEYTTYKSINITDNSRVKGNILKVINGETNEVLFVYNDTNFGTTYEFPKDVRSIRLETDTHEINVNYYYYARIIKEIDNDKMVRLVDLVKFKTYTQLTSGFKIIDERKGSTNNTVIHTADALITPKTSYAVARTDKSSYEPQSLAEPVIPLSLYINHLDEDRDTSLYKNWKNGKYLVLFSENILEVEAKDHYEFNIEKTKIGNKLALKVSCKNVNCNLQSAALNLKVTINPRKITNSNTIEVYAYDPAALKYSNPRSDVYDINNNGSFVDQVQYSATSFGITTPRELITGAQLTNYDSKGSITISPLVADVEMVDGKQEADMEIFLHNNALNPINNIVVIGKTGYVGNTYQIGTGDLGSEYNVGIKSAINVPEKLDGKVKIYYSIEETPTKDLNDENNKWVENPSDFKTIKSYMIVTDDDYTLNSGEEITFTYKVDIPNKRANLLKVSYFNHGVYFNYSTENGNYATNASSGKLGVRISRKYDLNITNSKLFSSNKISGTNFVATDEDGNTYVATTDSNGKATIKGLYANKEYTLTQSYINGKYVLDTEEKKFKVALDEDNNASIVKSGTYKNVTLTDNDSKLNMELENEMYVTLKLDVSDVDDGSKAEAMPFVITGKNFEKGKTIYTNSKGIVTLEGLEIGHLYTVASKTTDEYLPAKEFDIVLTRNVKTKEVNYAIKKSIAPKEVKSASSYTKFTATSYSLRYYYFSNNISGSGYASNTFELDLTEYYGNYDIRGSINYYVTTKNDNAYFKLYLSDNVNNKGKLIFEGLNATKKENIVISNLDENTKIIGGKKYYLTLDFNKTYYTPYTLTFNNFLVDTNGIKYGLYPETGFKDLEVTNYEGVINNLSKSLYNYDVDNTDNSIAEVKIKVKRALKYDLNITKVDKDTKEPLAGAMFRIEGPGIIEGGRYIVTDENGQVSLKLNAGVTGDYGLITGLETGSLIDSKYTLTEVYAPAGYKTENKPIKFSYKINYENNLATNGNLFYFENEDGSVNEFLSSNGTIDKLNVEIGNSPIVKITKKDADTGELLPDTYFTIEKIERLNGVEQLSPATAINGEIIGTKITIDGKTYFAVKTDKNGSLSLNLPEGDYKLKEIKASSEKYNITNEIYYFSVGKSVAYQAEGVVMSNASFIENESGSSSISTITSDGGYIVRDGYRVIKYNKNNEIEWSFGSQQSIDKYKTIYSTVYLDKSWDDYYSEYESEFSAYPYKIMEVSDGYIVSMSTETYYKLDKNGNYLYNTRSKNPCYQNGTKNLNGSYTYNNLNYYDSNYRAKNKTELPNGHIAVFTVYKFGVYGNNFYGYKLKDGTEIMAEVNHGYVLEYDNEGYLVKVTDITNNILSGIDDYVEENNLDVDYTYRLYDNNQTGRFMRTDDGNYLIINNIYIENRRYSFFACKLDKDFNNIYTRPLALYGNYINYEGGGQSIQEFSDGSYAVSYYGYSNYSIKFHEGDYYTYGDINMQKFYNTKYQEFEGVTFKDDDEDYDHSSKFVVKYNKDGIMENVVELGRYRYSGVPTKDLERFFRMDSTNTQNYYYMEDGSVIALLSFVTGDYEYDGTDRITSGMELERRTIFLANGDKYIIPKGKNNKYVFNGIDTWNIGEAHHTTVLYKINPDSRIEWIRSYDELDLGQNDYYTFDSLINYDKNNNKLRILLKSDAVAGSTDDLLPNNSIDLFDDNKRAILTTFDISDKINPESPEAYILNLVNKAKKFGINILTTTGGKVTVMDGNTKVYEGIGPKEVEKVKFSDDNKYDIIITPDEGYDVVSVKVNDEDATYTVRADGSLLLDKIKNVTETKNITVEFKQNVSRITVHHYLKGTTKRIYSDQVITGTYGTNYSVLPIDSKLYTLAKDDKGEYILPDNYEGTFKKSNQEVTFYYEPRMVKLLVNYYVEGTNNKLAETLIENYVLGSKYITKALDIKYYTLSDVIGSEEGYIDVDELEVTYFYKKNTISNITVIYKNVEDDTEFDRIEKQVPTGSYYETEGMKEIPEGYKLDKIEGEPRGIAEYENIVVTYNYKKIKVVPESPKTLDNIMLFIILGIISTMVLIITGKKLRKTN